MLRANPPCYINWCQFAKLLGKKQTTSRQETVLQGSVWLRPFLFHCFSNCISWSYKSLASFYRFCFACIFWMSVLWQHVCFPLRDTCGNWGHRAQKGSQALQGNLYPKESYSSRDVPAGKTPGSWLGPWSLGSQIHPCFPSPNTPSLWLFPPRSSTITILPAACFKRVRGCVCAIFPAGPTHLSGKDLSALRIL